MEVNCETDFVARTDDFQQLVKDVAMQVAAANPSYVSREDVPGAVVEKEREIYRQQMADQKKPPRSIDKIIEGKLEKFYAESCLLEQPFIRDASGKTASRTWSTSRRPRWASASWSSASPDSRWARSRLSAPDGRRRGSRLQARPAQDLGRGARG